MVLRGARRLGLVLARGRVRRVLLLVGLVFAALPAGSALAETIGKTGSNLDCGPGVIADTAYVVPFGGGTITSFSFQSTSASTGEELDFLVLRQTSGSNYAVVGNTGVVTLKGTGLETFSANISVVGGDILGFWSPSEGIDDCLAPGTSRLLANFNIRSDPDPGDVLDMPPFTHLDINESANFVPAVSLPPPPTSKQQCKHGGWKNFGSRFKNQGQCMRFVNSHHKHHPSGLPARVWQS